MIDIIYQIVKTVMNKELRGNITPDEFNKIAKQVQDEMFMEYFGDMNFQKNKQNRGLINKNYANLPKNIRQKITRFHAQDNLVYDGATTRFDLPPTLYFIEDNGLSYNGNVLEEMQTADFMYMSSTMGAPSLTFPVYEGFEDSIKVYPSEIQDNVNCRYLRRPLDPKWTYTVVGDVELFDNTISDFQDFELHISELPMIGINMLSYLGVNIRENDLVQYIEQLKMKADAKEQK